MSRQKRGVVPGTVAVRMAARTSPFDTTDLTAPSLDDDPSACVAGIHHMPASSMPVEAS